MHILAYSSLLLGLLFSLGGGGMALLQLWQGRDDYIKLVKSANWVVFLSLSLASALLLHFLFWEDYRFEYVASYTDAMLPMFYRLTAFWAGQPGSMLFWAFACAICGLLFMLTRSYDKMSTTTALWFWVFFYANMAFFCLILTCWSNPFMIVDPAPVDGQGLNPLLQNPGMIFHPPLLFMGYAGFTIPACAALAQMLTAADEVPWFRFTRPFIMFAWIFLTAGIVLGAWWAYMELGWGGYWAWDPVENASLLPWLAGTACLHIVAVQNSGGKLGRASAALMGITVISAFFATYLTRSGVIQSVHAFGDGGVGTPLLVFVIAAFVFSIAAAFSSPQKTPPLGAPIGREGALVLASWLFLALGLIILIATMWPAFSKMAGSKALGLEASFYNRVCLPLAGLLLILLSICTWLGKNRPLADAGAARRFYATCGAFAASLAAIWLAGYREPLPLISASAAIAALCAMSMHLFDRTAWASKRSVSAMGAHTGVALLALGIAFSGPYKVEKDLLLSKGQTETAGPYEVRLVDIKDGTGPGYDYLKAVLQISLDKKKTGILAPERRMYDKFPGMQFSEVDVISRAGEDVYASLLGMDEEYRVLVRFSLEPLVSWIWIGGALMCILPLFGIWHIRFRPKSSGSGNA